MRVSIVRSLLLAMAVSSLSFAQASASLYDDVVMSLSPSHYYPLQETKFGTVANLATPGKPGEHDGIFYDETFLPPNPSVPRGGLIADGGPSKDQGWVGSIGPDTQALINRTDGVTSIPLAGFGASPKSLFANNSVNVELGPGEDFANPVMTVSMWFKSLCNETDPTALCEGPPASQGGERLFTNNINAQDTGGSLPVDDLGHFQIDYGWGANLVVSLDNNFEDTQGDTLPPDETKGNFQVHAREYKLKNESWHHMVVSRNGDDIYDAIVVLDGIEIKSDRWTSSTTGWGTSSPIVARIAGRAPAGTTEHTFSGWVSNAAIWLGKQVSVSDARKMYLAGVNLPNNGTNIDAQGGVDAADAGIMFANWASDADPLSDNNADLIVDAADAGKMFENWTGDPSPAAPGTVTAEYNAATGELKIDNEGAINFYVQSSSGKITPISPAPTVPVGSLLTNNANRVGVTGLSPITMDNVSFGNIGADIPMSDLVLVYNGTLGGARTTLQAGSEGFRYIPEPASFGLIGMGLVGLLAARRRS